MAAARYPFLDRLSRDARGLIFLLFSVLVPRPRPLRAKLSRLSTTSEAAQHDDDDGAVVGAAASWVAIKCVFIGWEMESVRPNCN